MGFSLITVNDTLIDIFNHALILASYLGYRFFKILAKHKNEFEDINEYLEEDEIIYSGGYNYTDEGCLRLLKTVHEMGVYKPENYDKELFINLVRLGYTNTFKYLVSHLESKEEIRKKCFSENNNMLYAYAVKKQNQDVFEYIDKYIDTGLHITYTINGDIPPSPILIVGISGPPGSGKKTVANIIAKECDVTPLITTMNNYKENDINDKCMILLTDVQTNEDCEYIRNKDGLIINIIANTRLGSGTEKNNSLNDSLIDFYIDNNGSTDVLNTVVRDLSDYLSVGGFQA